MINANFLLGLPEDYKGICKIYPPTVKQVLTNKNFSQYCKLFTYSQEELEDDLENKIKDQKVPTPLEFLLLNSYHNSEFKQMAKDAFQFFIKQDVTFLYDKKMILIGGEESLKNITSVDELKILNEENFFDFQNLIRQSVGLKEVEPSDPNETALTKKLKKKIRKSKGRIKNGSNAISFGCNLASICCMNLGLNPLNIGEISYMSVNILTSIYQQKEKYQTDIDSLIAGADPKKVKPKYWIGEYSDLQEVNIEKN